MIAFHGTSTAVVPPGMAAILPPAETGRIQEVGRKVRLDRVFVTFDYGLARIYAGRARRRFGGCPVVYQVAVPDSDTVVLDDRPGASVLHAPGGWIVDQERRMR